MTQPSYCPSQVYFVGDGLSLFLADLLQTTIEPVLSASSEDAMNLFLASLQPAIHRMARVLAGKMYSISVDAEDLAQDGMIGAWKAAKRCDPHEVPYESLRAYCVQAAHHQMVDSIRRQLRNVPSISLDGYIEDPATGHPRNDREVADTSHQSQQQEPSPHRERIHAAMQQLTTGERNAIMARYAMDDTEWGNHTPVDLSNGAHRHAHKRAVKKLICLM
jgi:RNA polymerase sigma factor (sigma-70 family)